MRIIPARARFKVSVYCTVKNEETSVQELLITMLNQSNLPDEIVIVDGGSRDETIKVLEEYQKDHPSLIKIIMAPGANIAKGRNIAIKETKNDLIASTDAGVEYDKNWLKNLCHWFKEDPTVDIVSGFFKPRAETSYEQCVSILLYPNLCVQLLHLVVVNMLLRPVLSCLILQNIFILRKLANHIPSFICDKLIIFLLKKYITEHLCSF